MKKNITIGLLFIILIGCITWTKSYTQLKNTIPHARALLELKELRDAGSDAEADALLDSRLKYMSEILHAERTRLPFPPKEGISLAQEIDYYLDLNK